MVVCHNKYIQSYSIDDLGGKDDAVSWITGRQLQMLIFISMTIREPWHDA